MCHVSISFLRTMNGLFACFPVPSGTGFSVFLRMLWVACQKEGEQGERDGEKNWTDCDYC